MTQQELYEELIKVRNNLKKKNTSGGRSPVVCTDEAVRLIAVNAPAREEELQYITGLGKTFREKYGAAFMPVLERYHKERSASAKITDDVRKTLKNLESRLVNINKRNRLLYMGKIYDKYAYDLYGRQLPALLEYLTGKSRAKSFKLSEVDFSAYSAAKVNKFKKLLTLMREVTKDIRESGQNDLYVGYPYVIGRMAGEDFNIRAPLALFPVILERDGENVYIKLDESRDMLYNNNLLLTQYKFSGQNKELPSPVIEEIGENFISDLQKYYGEAGIRFDAELPKFSAFAEYKEGTFPKFANGEFHLLNNAVLGKFSMCSSALQKDFKEIIEKDEINKLLSELLENSEDIDYYSDDFRLSDADSKSETYCEKDIDYINALNASQENAIVSVEKCDELVIQGPPGTGKSQTITSLIVDSVLKGHNVLMVSQKKAALDVIYSRLGDLSRYALFVSDTKDKEFFYSQMFNLLYSDERYYFDEEAYRAAVQEIDKNVEDLEEIAAKLYEKDEKLGVPMYKIYQENPHNVFLSNYLVQSVGYENEVDAALEDVQYPALKNIRDKFSDEIYLSQLKEYFNLRQSFPWLLKVKDNIGRLELAEPLKLCAQLVALKKEYDNTVFLARPFKKGKVKKKIREIMSLCFKKRHGVKEFFISPAHLMDGLMSYERFALIRPLYDSLSESEKKYIESVNNVVDKTGVSMKDGSRNVFDYVVLKNIDAFEADNKAVLAHIQNYRLIVSMISKLIEKKKRFTQEKFKQYLKGVYEKNIALSKRFGEMKRNVESKRRMSVQRFINKFSFELFRGVKIWLMTPEVVSESLPLDNVFDLVIFDEASQLYVEKGVPAIQRAKKVVIAGDHKQLRPSSLGFGRFETDGEFDDDAEGNAALEEESLLDLARFKYKEVMLDFHYRSKYEELIAFSNYAFYHGRLRISPNTEQPAKPPIEVVRVKNGKWADRSNYAEAKAVVLLLKNYLKTRTAEQTVGVITFNSAQKDLIMDVIDEECAKDKDFALRCNQEWNRKRNGEDIGLFVKNIENVQGDERDTIIFSLAYAKNEQGKVVRNFGWLNQRGGENRLNVAISRAKEKIYVVTSITSSDLYVGDLQTEGPKIFKKYLEYAEAVSSGRKEVAHEILLSLCDVRTQSAAATVYESPFADEVYEGLIKRGFEVDKNVGIGGYSIDLAVKSQGKYILGIECDSHLYETPDSARDRDVHRQEYLESRGWNLHRVWSTNWWHSPQKELEKIQKIVGTLS